MRMKKMLAVCLVLMMSVSLLSVPALAVTSEESPTNGTGKIDNVIVVDLDVMPLTSYTDIEVPANTVIYFTSEWIQTINMSVSYKPKNLDLYYGIALYNTGSGNHWANCATGGSGSAKIVPGKTKSYYLYLANGNDKVIYADVTYTVTGTLSLD